MPKGTVGARTAPGYQVEGSPGGVPVPPGPVQISGNRYWDLAAASPLILLCLLGVLGFAIEIARQWPLRSGLAADAAVLSQAGSAMFLALQALMLLIRRLPLYKAPGIAPRAWAASAAYCSYLMLLLPKVTPSPAASMMSSILTLAGTVGSLCTLLWLGRAFAILPQARRLVVAGPYRWVRHPLYLTEVIAVLGLALQFRQPWALLIALVSIGLQFPRMRYEEQTLAACFPEYRVYAARTARILPFLLTDWRLNGALDGTSGSVADARQRS
jgi:protein-S-isoprenylcysteine O-methyltransferase Ste14